MKCQSCDNDSENVAGDIFNAFYCEKEFECYECRYENMQYEKRLIKVIKGDSSVDKNDLNEVDKPYV